MTAFYNDTDAYCSAWLKNLIAAGHITPGVVDQRSISEIRPEDVMGFDRVHLFAGIAGWDYALRLAGWPAGVPVWSGSCPCQPFSCAGKGLGTADKRHLWPEMFRLIRECRPPVVFGEQVAPKAGREWLSGVFADLESVGYAVAGADLCAAGVGAPHIRQRLYWVAVAGCEPMRRTPGRGEETGRKPCLEATGSSDPGGVGYSQDGQDHFRESGNMAEAERCRGCGDDAAHVAGDAGGVDNSAGARSESAGKWTEGQTWNGARVRGLERGRATGGLADSSRRGLVADGGAPRSAGHVEQLQQAGWNGGDQWWPCRDGKQRRIPLEPALFPLANGLPGRVGQLRAAGNSIVPQLAAAFIETVMEVIQ